MKIFLSVGEPSGDVHGANLVRYLRERRDDIECVGFGGPKMAAAGCELVADLTQLAVMFLWSVIKNYGRFRAYLKQADEIFRTQKIDAVVLIDYPGFNWQIARRAKKYGIPVFYYGVPQMWAWAPWRIRKLKRLVDHVLCKLPFEKPWFAARGVEAHAVGHPFFDDLMQRNLDKEFCRSFIEDERRTLLLLPGSRDAEVELHWPVLRDAALKIAAEQPVRIVAGAFKSAHREQIAADVSQRGANIEVFEGKTPELMSIADGCIACSGSVSLELMYYTVPTVIVYRVSRFIFLLQKFFIRCRYITLVNLLATDKLERAGRGAYDPEALGAEQVPMPEYLTYRDCSTEVAKRMGDLLSDEVAREANREWLKRLKADVAKPGATERAARIILEVLTNGGANESTEESTQDFRKDQNAA
ncbi:MAG: lipid-A-disaccharide synthase [Pirellulaceae bacterium]|nr:lipid-A-disaccharide synthase [Pirellulaceae bacterium]